MSYQTVLTCAWSFLAGAFFYLWIRTRRSLRHWRQLEKFQARRIYELGEMVTDARNARPMETVGAEVARTVNELQVENATLRSDIETSCKMIDKQRAAISDLTGQLNKMISENRRFVGALRGGKRRK